MNVIFLRVSLASALASVWELASDALSAVELVVTYAGVVPALALGFALASGSAMVQEQPSPPATLRLALIHFPY